MRAVVIGIKTEITDCYNLAGTLFHDLIIANVKRKRQNKASQKQKVIEYDQEIPPLHTADQPTAPRGRATEHL